MLRQYDLLEHVKHDNNFCPGGFCPDTSVIIGFV